MFDPPGGVDGLLSLGQAASFPNRPVPPCGSAQRRIVAIPQFPSAHLDRTEASSALRVGDPAPRHEAWQAELMFAGLKRLRWPVILATPPGEGHVFARADHGREAWRRALEWLGPDSH